MSLSQDMLLRSSMVMNGTGRYVVTAVGDETEIGHVARQATELTGVKTPLNIQLDQLAKLISKVGSAVVGGQFRGVPGSRHPHQRPLAGHRLCRHDRGGAEILHDGGDAYCDGCSRGTADGGNPGLGS